MGGSGNIAFDATLKDYLQKIDEADLLTWEQEKQLAKNIINENDPEARDTLIRSNLRLVVNIAKSFGTKGLTFSDLIEEGNIGLLRAIDSFDPAHGVRFSTYAAWWIKQSIKKSMLENAQPIHIPTYMVELINHWRHTASSLQTKLGREPMLEEMAEEMSMSLKKAAAVRDIAETVEPNAQSEEQDNFAQINNAITDENIQSPCDAICNEEEITKALENLEQIDQREAQVLKLRFGLDGQEPLTLKQIGKELNLTRERIRQIQRSALENLQELMTDQDT